MMQALVAIACLIFIGQVSAFVEEVPAAHLFVLLLWRGSHASSSSRPAVNASQTVPIDMELSLTQIHSYDQDKRYVTVSAWLGMTWSDYRLKWDQEEHGIRSVSIPSNVLWLPDIKLLNGIDPDMERGEVNAIVSHTGDVLWTIPVRYTIPCDPAKEFEKPNHEQDVVEDYPSSKAVRCSALFGSWTYDSTKLTIKIPTWSFSQYIGNPSYSLSDIWTLKGTETYDFFNAAWDQVTLSFTLSVRN